MQYRKYGKLDFQVSALGMGCMRLPRIVREGQDHAEVDREKAYEMIRYAVEHGVNYFDTALGYHNQTSEAVLGEALDGGYRERVKIATKQPFAAMKTQADIRRNLENTLRKLRTDHIDMYLIHNIQKSTWEETKRRKVIEEYEKFREERLIRAIGFSYHGNFPCFSDVLNYYDWDMCQIQQNMLDVNREATEEGIRLAGKKGAALVIMEPLRGGGLANAPAKVQELYDSYPQRRTPVEWAFRHLIDYPEISCILSGMTTMEQLKDNIALFSRPDAAPGCLSQQERTIIAKARDVYRSFSAILCTGCEYCTPCPKGVDIPGIFFKYNAGVMFGNYEQPKRSYLIANKRRGSDASRCIACGACEKKCPQHIDIIRQLKIADETLTGWIE